MTSPTPPLDDAPNLSPAQLRLLGVDAIEHVTHADHPFYYGLEREQLAEVLQHVRAWVTQDGLNPDSAEFAAAREIIEDREPVRIVGESGADTVEQVLGNLYEGEWNELGRDYAGSLASQHLDDAISELLEVDYDRAAAGAVLESCQIVAGWTVVHHGFMPGALPSGIGSAAAQGERNWQAARIVHYLANPSAVTPERPEPPTPLPPAPGPKRGPQA